MGRRKIDGNVVERARAHTEGLEGDDGVRRNRNPGREG